MAVLKYVYLIVYTLSAVSNGGGPSISIQQMPNKHVCEQVATATNKLIKEYTGRTSVFYWCIETN